MRPIFTALATFFLCLLGTLPAHAAHKWGLQPGTPELKSTDRLAFGPDGVLFIGDAKQAAIFAIDTGDISGDPAKVTYDIPQLAAKISAAVGTNAELKINDLAVNPLSGNLYLAVSYGAEKTAVIVKVTPQNELTVVPFKNIPFLQATLPNPPEDKITGEGARAKNRRNDVITDLAYVNGKVLVAGLTSEAAPSNVRELAFPFNAADSGAQLEIYHAAHGKVEDYAAVRTFIPFNVDGQPAILAGFTCTPLVRFSVSDLAAGKKVRGTTVAELGNRNTPLDMIAYEKEGHTFLLMANSARGVMKISTHNIGRKEGLSTPVSGGETAGQFFEQIAALAGTVQLDRLNATQAVVVQANDKELTLRSVELP
jgi:hypothetical protein